MFRPNGLINQLWLVLVGMWGEFSARDSQNSSADVCESATMSRNHGQVPRIHETSGKQDCDVKPSDFRR